MVVEEIFGEERGQLVWLAINTCMRELFVEYKNMYGASEETTEVTNSNQCIGGIGGMLAEKITKKMRLSNCSTSSAKSKWRNTFVEEIEAPEKNIDILCWWKVNASRFPILAHMACDVLAIPITTVASKSIFSTSGCILDDLCTSLTPFMLEALVYTQDWPRRSTHIDIKESAEELAIMEKGTIFVSLVFPIYNVLYTIIHSLLLA